MSLNQTPRLLHAKTLAVSGILGAILLLVLLLSWSSLGDKALFVLLLVSVLVLIAIQLESYYRSLDVIYQQNEKFQEILRQQEHQRNRQLNDYYQIESLFSIFSLLRLRYPLPPMREWAISPDFAKHLIALIYAHNPQLIVEVSSGISTVIMGYCLQAVGSGKVISLEHDQQYAKISANYLVNHNLQDTAEVIHAPLNPIQLGEQSWHWYDPTVLKDLPQKIDLLVIDGPPGDLQPLSRYPALPLLIDALSDNCLIILDDGDRVDEQKIVERWQQEFALEIEKIHNEKGAFILRRSSKTSPSLPQVMTQ